MKSYKQIENELYNYWNKKFRVGQWTSTTLSNYYNNLDYRKAVNEAEIINQLFNSTITVPDISDIANDNKLKFSVHRLVSDIAQNQKHDTLTSTEIVSTGPTEESKWEPISSDSKPVNSAIDYDDPSTWLYEDTKA
jgi:hypothetical protein